MLVSLYTLYYLFAQIGMLAFGGKITIDKADDAGLFYLMNFNDFSCSLITLFHLSVVNNWYVTANLYCYVFGNSWPRLFFVLWWCVTVLVIQNLIVAFVLEIYATTSAEVDKEFKRRAYVK